MRFFKRRVSSKYSNAIAPRSTFGNFPRVAELGSKVCQSCCSRMQGPRLAKLMTATSFGRVQLGVFCHHGCTALLGRPTRCKRLLDSRWPSHNRHQAPHRGAHHVADRPAGLRGPRVGMEGLGSTSSDPATLLVRKFEELGRSGRCGFTRSWCSCSRIGRPTGGRGTRWSR